MITETANWSAAQSSAQYRAIAWLRWRIFLNSFRRKGSAGELVARIIVIPIAAAVLIGPTIGAGIGGWYFVRSGHFDYIALLLWGAFAFCQFLNLQLGQPGTTFDPTQLIRFPLRAASYTAVRLFFGVLSPSNISAVCIALAVAIGVTLALPQLWAYAFVALLFFATANVLFSRMLFAWIDRWLSTRRAREIFTACIFIFSLGIQWANLSFNPAYNRHSGHAGQYLAQQKLNHFNSIYQHVLPWIAGLPPNLTASALHAGQSASLLRYLICVFGCALYAAAFYAVFAWRTRVEYRGENLSDQANAVATPAALHSSATAFAANLPAADSFNTYTSRSAATMQRDILAALLHKEFLTLRRNTGIAYGVLAPIFLVFIFAFKMAAGRHFPWLFPAAAAYALMGIVPLAYNSFGLEGAGVQFHFLAPVRMRDVILSKNLMSFALAALDLTLVFAVISYISGMPSLRMIVTGLLWAAAMLFLSLAIGNRRSITAPKKIEPGRTASKQASPLSGLISFLVLLTGAALCAALFYAEYWLNVSWLLVPTLAVAAVAAFLVYRSGLNSFDRFAFDNREPLIEELCKK